MSLRILLADDHKMFRDAVRPLLEGTPGLAIVGEAGDGLDAVRLAAEVRPDVVVMDISMPGLNGIEAARQILAADPRVRVIILSMHADRRFVTETLKAGAAGYLLKDGPISDLVEAIRTVAQGRTFLSRSIQDVVVQDYVGLARRADGSAFSVLSAREREVLQLLAEGRTTKEIADRLSISAKTVETHRRQTMDKLGLRSVAELTKYAIREGLTPLD
jgi:DNA-binding NarL/FixJ family response regulator